eukprot:TRINITY_DN110158_c0_g1_i1.p1 TRINITY_DN110158_c0_g1~~TRINITY_DN110158_c0_g1_i1.p1  ORF type:complete len:690 (-),score=142.35 TRINITY_DN110158_c0_g1_i1:46-2115(-)
MSEEEAALETGERLKPQTAQKSEASDFDADWMAAREVSRVVSDLHHGQYNRERSLMHRDLTLKGADILHLHHLILQVNKSLLEVNPNIFNKEAPPNAWEEIREGGFSLQELRKKAVLLCQIIVATWWFSLLGCLFIVIHCVALVVVANSSLQDSGGARSLSAVCTVYFSIEIFVRVVACELYFWQDGWLTMDIILQAMGIAEAILARVSTSFGPGQFIFASLRVTRLVLVIKVFFPRSGTIFAHSFGVSKIALLALTTSFIFMWVMGAIVLRSFIDILEVEDGPLRDIDWLGDFTSAFLTQLYIVGNGIDWTRRITGVCRDVNVFTASLLGGLLTAAFFTLKLLVQVMMTCIFVEYSENAAKDYDKLQEARNTRIRLDGIDLLETLLCDVAHKTADWQKDKHGSEEPVEPVDTVTTKRSSYMAGSTSLSSSQMSFSNLEGHANVLHVSARDVLEEELRKSEKQLAKKQIDASEVLLFFDGLAEGAQDNLVSISELILGVVKLMKNADGDMTNVDHLQKQCTRVVEEIDRSIDDSMASSLSSVENLKTYAAGLLDSIKTLRMYSKRAVKDLADKVQELDDQYEACKDDETQKALLKKMQKRNGRIEAVQEVRDRMLALKKQTALLKQQDERSRVFGMPSLLDEKSRSLKPSNKVINESQFTEASKALRQAVKERLAIRLKHQFAAEETRH